MNIVLLALVLLTCEILYEPGETLNILISMIVLCYEFPIVE